MAKKGFHFAIISAFLFLFPFCVGGYYVYYCALANVILISSFVGVIIKKSKINLQYGVPAIVISFMTLMYLVVKLWALDSTMSLHGFIKFLTPFLLMLNIWQIESDNREKLLYVIPYSATAMTVVSYSLGQLDRYSKVFFDDMHDLHGAFQYANAYAIFALIGALIALFKPASKKSIKVFDFICAVICLAGVYLSDSRATYLVTLGVAFVIAYTFVMVKLKTNKKRIALTAVMFVVGVVGLAVATRLGITDKIIHVLKTDGSITERLLYYTDAFQYALKHPFGKGAYAFYFGQPEFQSAYYYAIDVHCDYLQYMVEIGIIPAVAFIVLLVHELFSKKTSVVQKTVILAISTHCMIDFDLQFISIMCILIACFNYDREKVLEFKRSIILILVIIAAFIMNCLVGLSAFYNNSGYHEKSLYYYKNTPSLIVMMKSTTDKQVGYDYATQILKINNSIFEANQVLANIYIAEEDYSKAVYQMEQVLKKSPRNMKHYKRYINTCIQAYRYYDKNGDTENKELVRQKILSVPDMLKDLEDRTPERAKLYGRYQAFSLDDKYLKKIERFK